MNLIWPQFSGSRASSWNNASNARSRGDPELRRQMACQAARKAASHFDAGSMVRGYEGLYGKLLAAQPGAAPAGGLPNGIST